MGSLTPYLRSFDRFLRADGKSDRTRKIYRARAAGLDAWLDQLPTPGRRGTPGTSEKLMAPHDPCEVTSRHIAAYVDAVAVRTSQATASNHYRALQQFFKYLALEEAISDDPFAELSPPKVIAKPATAIPYDALERLLTACKGTDLGALRDTGIIMVLIDTGLRPGESAALNHAANPLESDVDFDYNVLHATDAHGRRRVVPFGLGTRRALERYLRHRDEFRQAVGLPIDGPLWIGALRKGGLTGSGIAQMLTRRCAQAGIARINPYEFRHTFAHRRRADSDDERDLKRLLGLRTSQMLSRYRTTAAGEPVSAPRRTTSRCDRLVGELSRRSTRR